MRCAQSQEAPVLFAASFNFGKFLLLDAASGGVMAGLSDRKLAMPAVPPDAPGEDPPPSLGSPARAACGMPWHAVQSSRT